MTLRMKSQLLNLQPQQVKFYHLLFNLVSSLIFNSFQIITSQPMKFLIQVLFAKVRSNTFINIRFICSKLPIISVEAGGEESWISDDSCDDVNNNPFCKFDGGDCCGANVIKQYCIDCDCLGKFAFLCYYVLVVSEFTYQYLSLLRPSLLLAGSAS